MEKIRSLFEGREKREQISEQFGEGSTQLMKGEREVENWRTIRESTVKGASTKREGRGGQDELETGLLHHFAVLQSSHAELGWVGDQARGHDGRSC